MVDVAHTFRVEAKLFRMDSRIYDFTDAQVQIFENPLSVVSEDGKVIGHAVLCDPSPGDPSVRATLFLDYATPERFDIENGIRMYARANGTAALAPVTDVDLYVDFNKKIPVMRVFVENIIITRLPPADSAVNPITIPKDTP